MTQLLVQLTALVSSFMQELFCIAEQKEGLHQLVDERQDNEAG